MADWCALPGTAVVLIARRFQLIEDFIAFRSTCSSWHQATTFNDFSTSRSSSSSSSSSCCHKLPILMVRHFERKESSIEDEAQSLLLKLRLQSLRFLPDDNQPELIDSEEEMDDIGLKLEKLLHDVTNDPAAAEAGPDELAGYECNQLMDDDDDDDQHKFVRLIQREGPEADHERKFLSLSKGKTCKVSFAEANNMEYRGSKGWLIMVESSTYNMCLLHPITRDHIPLPKLPNQMIHSKGVFRIYLKDFITGALSASPSQTSDYFVMVVFLIKIATSPDTYELSHYTGFWKPGNLTWTLVDDIPCAQDLNYYNGKFYALIEDCQVWMCDVSGPNPTTSKIAELPCNWSRPYAQLVECGGRLLMVAPYCCYYYDMALLDQIEMVEIDVIKGSYSTITSLGSSSVFLGRNEAFSIDANEFPGIIEPNSIFFGNGSYQVVTPEPNHESEPNYGSGVWLNF